MKPGMTISCVGHAAALAFGLMAISAQPMEAPPVQALPVSFVSEKDFTQLTQGVLAELGRAVPARRRNRRTNQINRNRRNIGRIKSPIS